MLDNIFRFSMFGDVTRLHYLSVSPSFDNVIEVLFNFGVNNNCYVTLTDVHTVGIHFI